MDKRLPRLIRALRLLAFLLCWPAWLAASEPVSMSAEGQLKASFLINFLKYVEWPTAGRESSVVCLFGRDTLGPSLAAHEGRLVLGRAVRLQRVSSPDQLTDCQILFVSEMEEARFAAVLRWAEAHPVLTVSDAEYFARQGGAVALVRTDARLTFEINLDALNRAGLKPASQMLRLARQVYGGGR